MDMQEIRLKSPYSPGHIYRQLEPYIDSEEELKIIFPDDATDAFRVFFDLNALKNVSAIEVPWNFGTAGFFSKSGSGNECGTFNGIYRNNIHLLEIAAGQIFQKYGDFFIEYGKCCKNLLGALLVNPISGKLKKIAFREAPENEKASFIFEGGCLISSDRKILYKRIDKEKEIPETVMIVAPKAM